MRNHSDGPGAPAVLGGTVVSGPDGPDQGQEVLIRAYWRWPAIADLMPGFGLTTSGWPRCRSSGIGATLMLFGWAGESAGYAGFAGYCRRLGWPEAERREPAAGYGRRACSVGGVRFPAGCP
jgi:hypothetical protein